MQGRVDATPRLADRLELHDCPEGLEAIVGGQRRLRLSPDAAWLVAQIDGRLTVEGVAERLQQRFGREVTPAEARELLERTLITQGIATFEPSVGSRPVKAVRMRIRIAHAPASVARIASGLRWIVHPVLAIPGAIAAAVAIGTAFALAPAAAWRSPTLWGAAIGAAALSLYLHEWLHAAAYSRAGGTPGAITFSLERGLRMAAELPHARQMSRAHRVQIDIAGAYAQWLMAGAIAATALALQVAPPAPVLALILALAVVNLIPAPGSDGAWLWQDLLGSDAPDSVMRLPSLRRLFALHRDALVVRIAASRASAGRPGISRVLPTMLAMSFPDASPRQLRRMALDSAVARTWFARDARQIGHGERPERILHASPIRRLRSQGRGALVCSMHLGPFPYVPVALADLGCAVMAYAADNVRNAAGATWTQAAAHQGASFEPLIASSSRDALRAVRGMREGRFLVLYMDGQFAASRDQHRADFKFLGQDLYMRTGPALLAERAGVPIVASACYWDALGRRIVRFSDPFDPPASRAEADIVQRTAELYRWFEPIVAARPGQWPGWSWPIQHWRRTGGSPTVTRGDFESAIARTAAAIAGTPHGLRLHADATHSQWLEQNGARLLLDGRGRRVLEGTSLSCWLLDAAHAGMRLEELPVKLGGSIETLATEIARLSLSGVIELRS